MQKRVDEALARLNRPGDVQGGEVDVFEQLRTVANRLTAGSHRPDSFNALVAAAILDLHSRVKK